MATTRVIKEDIGTNFVIYEKEYADKTLAHEFELDLNANIDTLEDIEEELRLDALNVKSRISKTKNKIYYSYPVKKTTDSDGVFNSIVAILQKKGYKGTSQTKNAPANKPQFNIGDHFIKQEDPNQLYLISKIENDFVVVTYNYFGNTITKDFSSVEDFNYGLKIGDVIILKQSLPLPLQDGDIYINTQVSNSDVFYVADINYLQMQLKTTS